MYYIYVQEKLTSSQLDLLHTTNKCSKNKEKNYKQKLIQLRRHGPGESLWSQSWGRKWVYSGKGLWKR